MITNNDPDPVHPGRQQPVVDPTQPVQPVDPADAERFSNLQQGETDQDSLQAAADETAISPEELQRQIQQNLFKQGFNKAIEKAREIAKELKNG